MHILFRRSGWKANVSSIAVVADSFSILVVQATAAEGILSTGQIGTADSWQPLTSSAVNGHQLSAVPNFPVDKLHLRAIASATWTEGVQAKAHQCRYYTVN